MMDKKKLLDSFLEIIFREKVDSSRLNEKGFSKVYSAKLKKYIGLNLSEKYEEKFGGEKDEGYFLSESLISDSFDVFLNLLEKDLIFRQTLLSYSEGEDDSERENRKSLILNKFITSLKNYVIDKVYNPLEKSLYRKLKKAIKNNSFIETNFGCITKSLEIPCQKGEIQIPLEKWVRETNFEIVYDKDYEYQNRIPVYIHQKDVDSLLSFVIERKGAVDFNRFLDLLKKVINYNIRAIDQESVDFSQLESSSLEEKIKEALLSRSKEKDDFELYDPILVNNIASTLLYVLKEKELQALYLMIFLSYKIEEECGEKVRGEKLAELLGMPKSTFYDYYNRALKKMRKYVWDLTAGEILQIFDRFSRKIYELYGNMMYELEKRIKEALKC